MQGIGIDISKRQVMRLLNDRQEGFVEETRDVLRSGLVSAPWLTVMIPAHEPLGGSEKLQWWTGPNSVTLGGETKTNAYVFISTTAARIGGSGFPGGSSLAATASPDLAVVSYGDLSVTVLSYVKPPHMTNTATINA